MENKYEWSIMIPFQLLKQLIPEQAKKQLFFKTLKRVLRWTWLESRVFCLKHEKSLIGSFM